MGEVIADLISEIGTPCDLLSDRPRPPSGWTGSCSATTSSSA